MQSFLSQDAESRELRLVFTDLWDGKHERTEFRVITVDGSPVRGGEAHAGLTAYRDSFGGYYVKIGPMRREVPFKTENHAAAESQTPCRRLASKSGHAKCGLCWPHED